MSTTSRPGDVVASVLDASKTSTVHRRTTPMLAPTSFDFRSSTLVAVAGPSGSGKTTLCGLLMQWEQPDGGTVTVRAEGTGWARRAVAPQRLALIDSLSCGDNIRLAAWAGGTSDREPTVDELARLLDVAHLLERHPREVSLGEQQRVAVARALVGSPRLVVLDEPSCHQDEGHVGALVAALRRAADRGSCVVVATHDPELITVADEVLVLAPPA